MSESTDTTESTTITATATPATATIAGSEKQIDTTQTGTSTDLISVAGDKLTATAAGSEDQVTAEQTGTLANPIAISTTSASTSTPAPTTIISASIPPPKSPPTGPCMLFLAINGVPQVRISGATPEETAVNAELQAMDQIVPGGGVVSFRIQGGQVKGVRICGRCLGGLGNREYERG
jgi:hypothetical protein